MGSKRGFGGRNGEFRAVGWDLGTGMGYLEAFRVRDGVFRVLRGDLGARMGYLGGLEVFGVWRMLGGV